MAFGQPASKRLEADSVSSTVTLVQTGKLHLTAIRAINTTAAAAYLQIFDSATSTAISLGTTVPDWVVKSGASDPSDGDGFPTTGILIENGLVVASTTTSTGATGAAQHVRITVI